MFFIFIFQNVRKCREKLKNEENQRAERLHFLKNIEIPRLEREIMLEHKMIENFREFFCYLNLNDSSDKQWTEFFQSEY